MKTHWLEREQVLDVSRADLFPFFADAGNLARITPAWLSFQVQTPLPIEMREGTLIDYRISLRGIPMRWQSEISVWEPPHRFVDRQVVGPYRVWIHEHTFEAVGEDATLVRDRVEYAAPGGGLIRKLFVDPQLKRIFDFRQKAMAEIFGARGEGSLSPP